MAIRGAATHMVTTSATYTPPASAPFAIDKPANKPTSDMLTDTGALIKSAITKIIIATSKASALNCKAPFGSRTFTVFVIPMPWATSPTEKPAAPRSMPNRLLMILDPTAGPTHADRLLPETNITAMKVNTRTAIDSHSMLLSLEDGSNH